MQAFNDHSIALLIEDQPSDAKLVEAILRHHQIVQQVLWAPTLGQAKTLLAEQPVQLLLVDLGLPDTSGLETVFELRLLAPDVPLIVLTANTDETNALHALEAGAEDYLIKGEFTADNLIRSIRYAISRSRAEVELRRRQRLYATLSETNHAILHFSHEQALFEALCRTAVKHGEFSLAWVGKPDAAGWMQIAAASGNTHYLQAIRISVHGDRPEGQGPTGRAFRDGMIQIVNDFQTAPNTAIWAEAAKRYHITAAAAFPLCWSGNIQGVFTIYATESNFFGPEETQLLDKMTGNLSFAVDAIHHREALRQSEERLALAVGAAGFGIWDDQIESGQLVWDHRMRALYGLSANDRIDHALWRSLIHPDDLADSERMHADARESEGPHEAEFRVLRGDGETRHIKAYCRSVCDLNGKPVRVTGINLDNTAQRLAETDSRLAAIAFEAQVAITITDAKGNIQRVNNTFTEVTGYRSDEVIGKNPRLLQSGCHAPSFYQTMWHHLNHTGFWEGEIWNRNKLGHVYPEWLSITAVKNHAGVITHYVGTFFDITKNKAAEKKIHALAFYDPLTNLTNRRLLLERLRHALIKSERDQQYGALFMLDLDEFKTLNDTRGHSAGDALLVQVGQRLRKQLRATDTAARLGGDEFILLCEQLGEDERQAAVHAERIAEQLLDVLRKPYDLHGADQAFHCSASIGVALFCGHGSNVDDLLKQADVAMFAAKRAGRDTIRFFSTEMQRAIDQRANLAAALRRALDHDELQLFYQPQVDRFGHLLGAEALLRWFTPDGQTVSPGEFIPLAEETGLILPLGEWVLNAACADLQTLQRYPHTASLCVSVNVSARQLAQPHFVEQVQATVAKYGTPTTRLHLELTEGSLFADLARTQNILSELQTLGIEVELDDFGTGYSSLAQLKYLPLNTLKIDQTLVRDVDTDPSDAAIVRAAMSMAQALSLPVIAEGVERPEQLDFLLSIGCQRFQGYWFGRPMPFKAFLDHALQTAAADPTEKTHIDAQGPAIRREG